MFSSGGVQQLQWLLGVAEEDVVDPGTDEEVQVVVVDVQQQVGDKYSGNCGEDADHHQGSQDVTDKVVAPEKSEVDHHDEAVAEELFDHRIEQSWRGGTDWENIVTNNRGGREEEGPGDEAQFVSWQIRGS